MDRRARCRLRASREGYRAVRAWRGVFRVTKRISDPPRLADFAALKLPEKDLAALKTCKVGDCEIKLSEEALERIRTSIDWSKPTAKADAEALVRQLAYEYVYASHYFWTALDLRVLVPDPARGRWTDWCAHRWR